MVSRLVGSVILLALGWVLVQLSQPYMHSYQFEQLVRREVDTPSRAGASVLARTILDQGHSMGFNLTPEDIQVDRLERGYQVNVHYSVPLEVTVYKPMYKSILDF